MSYRELIGNLTYIAQGTRPDIAYAVGVLSRFNSCYDKNHWTAAKRVHRYLKSTAGVKLMIKRDVEALAGFIDSNWAADKSDYKSTSGYVFKLSSGAVSWSSKKKATIAKCTEAEYMTLSLATSEAIWLKGLHNEFVNDKLEKIFVYCDNKGAIDLVKKSSISSKNQTYWHVALFRQRETVYWRGDTTKNCWRAHDC